MTEMNPAKGEAGQHQACGDDAETMIGDCAIATHRGGIYADRKGGIHCAECGRYLPSVCSVCGERRNV